MTKQELEAEVFKRLNTGNSDEDIVKSALKRCSITKLEDILSRMKADGR